MRRGRGTASIRSSKTSRSGANGMHLAEVHALAQALGLDLRPARRAPGAEILLPAVVHWKLGHFAALLREASGQYLVEDPTFGESFWVHPEALEAEVSGYFLVSAVPLPAGWSAVGAAEAGSVWGRGNTGQADTDATRKSDLKLPGKPCTKGMAQYAVHAMLVSLNLEDVPLGYVPPRGPPVELVLTYNQRDANQPALFDYTHAGPKWTIDWISYVEDRPRSPAADVKVYLSGGGAERYEDFDEQTQAFAPQRESGARLRRTGPERYERRLPDGSVERFTRTRGNDFGRKVFLTERADPAGQALRFEYDASLRLVAVVDALGQTNRLSYEVSADPFLLTAVEDAFGRRATLSYTPAGQLASITDVAGLTSRFTYAAGDFVDALITPYGTTTFVNAESYSTNRSGPPALENRMLEVTDPLGHKERTEFIRSSPPEVMPASEAVAPDPGQIRVFNRFLHTRNTYFWDKRAMDRHPGDYRYARVYHWLHDSIDVHTSILESRRDPLEAREWYRYQGQDEAHFVADGMVGRGPSHVARVIENRATQLSRYTYNAVGNVTGAVDPLGRTMRIGYASNLVDVVGVWVGPSTNEEQILQVSYDHRHLPTNVVDAAGHVTRFSYTTFGQPAWVENALGERTSFTYDPSGYLRHIQGPVSNASLALSYDAYGRVATVTDAEGDQLGFAYDALDRLTEVSYPDGSTERVVPTIGSIRSYSSTGWGARAGRSITRCSSWSAGVIPWAMSRSWSGAAVETSKRIDRSDGQKDLVGARCTGTGRVQGLRRRIGRELPLRPPQGATGKCHRCTGSAHRVRLWVRRPVECCDVYQHAASHPTGVVPVRYNVRSAHWHDRWARGNDLYVPPGGEPRCGAIGRDRWSSGQRHNRLYV